MDHEAAGGIAGDDEVGFAFEIYVAAVDVEAFGIDDAGVAAEVYERAVGECEPELFVVIGGDFDCLKHVGHSAVVAVGGGVSGRTGGGLTGVGGADGILFFSIMAPVSPLCSLCSIAAVISGLT